MPSSPEHLSDRCLSIFFYILLNSFQIYWCTFSGGGGILSQAGFSGGRLYAGKLYAKTPGKNYLRELGSLLRKFKITNSKELKKDSTLPLKIGT